jgi:hypothetical protein
MSSSDRVLQGYKTRGSQSVVVGFDESAYDQTGSNFFDAFRQGIDLRSHDDLFGYINFKIRSNSDPVSSIDSNRNDVKHFDDFTAGISTSFDRKKTSNFFDHRLDRRDLGQIETFEMKFGPFIDKDNPFKRYTKQNEDFIFISALDILFKDDVNIGGLPLDGFVEPLMIRSEAERSHPEFPFLAKGFRGSIGQVEDVYRKNDLIRTGYNLSKGSEEAYDVSALHFLDATEYYGPVDLMPVFAEDARTLAPFEDRANDRELIYGRYLMDDQVMLQVLTDESYSLISDDNVVEFDIMGRNGWLFNDAGGRAMDSLAYGGLLRG